jgi:hypothetical protein
MFDLTRAVKLHARYDCNFKGDFRGAKGADGYPGLDGYSAYWDSGDDGGDGGDGGDGDDGASGSRVEVRIALLHGRPEDRPLLQVEAKDAARTERFLVDPRLGALTLDASGGAGGHGGSAGMGGIGGRNGGSSGENGQRGCGGSGGDGGEFDVAISPDARPYLSAVKFVNEGGASGSGEHPFSSWCRRPRDGERGPPPRVEAAPLAPLW